MDRYFFNTGYKYEYDIRYEYLSKNHYLVFELEFHIFNQTYYTSSYMNLYKEESGNNEDIVSINVGRLNL